MGLLGKMRTGSGRTRTHESRGSYGIEQAAELLRSLPQDNLELVFTVVRKTLESFDVDVDKIVRDAQKKLDRLDGQVATCRLEIEQLEKEIAMRRSAIEVLSKERGETQRIQRHLRELQAASDMGEIPDYAKPGFKASPKIDEPEIAAPRIAAPKAAAPKKKAAPRPSSQPAPLRAYAEESSDGYIEEPEDEAAVSAVVIVKPQESEPERPSSEAPPAPPIAPRKRSRKDSNFFKRRSA